MTTTTVNTRARVTESMRSYFREHDLCMSRDVQDVFVRMLVEVYEWGSVDTFDLTHGLSNMRELQAERMLFRSGLVARVRNEACIRDKGMRFVEKHKLSEFC